MKNSADKRGCPGRERAAIRRSVQAVSIACCCGFPAWAQAEEAPGNMPQIWLNPGIYSQHFDSDKGLRNNNIGFGAEAILARDHVLMAGNFINSNRARTRFAAYQWRPLHWQFSGYEVGAGIALGAFDGYPNYRDGGWFIAPLPLLAIEGRRLGVNLSLIPTVKNRFDGALAVQVKLRVW